MFIYTTQYRKDNYLLSAISVTLDVSHFDKLELNLLAPENTTQPKNIINHPSIISHHHHHPSKEKTQKIIINKKKKKKEGGGEEEMVRLVCLYIQHNIGKSTYSAP